MVHLFIHQVVRMKEVAFRMRSTAATAMRQGSTSSEIRIWCGALIRRTRGISWGIISAVGGVLMTHGDVLGPAMKPSRSRRTMTHYLNDHAIRMCDVGLRMTYSQRSMQGD